MPPGKAQKGRVTWGEGEGGPRVVRTLTPGRLGVTQGQAGLGRAGAMLCCGSSLPGVPWPQLGPLGLLLLQPHPCASAPPSPTPNRPPWPLVGGPHSPLGGKGPQPSRGGGGEAASRPPPGGAPTWRPAAPAGRARLHLGSSIYSCAPRPAGLANIWRLHCHRRLGK